MQDQFKSIAFTQSNYIVPAYEGQNKKRNPIVDQRDYQGVTQQTSEGEGGAFKKNRTQQPQLFPTQQSNQFHQGSNQQQNQRTQNFQQTPAQAFGQNQTPAQNNIQNQPIYQSSAVPTEQITQSQARQNSQGQFQNNPITQSYHHDKQKQSQSQFNRPIQQSQINDNQIRSSQQYKRENNTFMRSQQNTQPNQFNQQYNPQRVTSNSRERPSNNSDFNTPANPNSQQNRNSYEDPKVSIRNNSQSRVQQPDNFNGSNRIKDQQRVNQNINEQNNFQDQQFEQVKRSQKQPSAINKTIEKQNSQFPLTHQYFNSSSLEQLNPIVPDKGNYQNDFHHYAQFFDACGYSLDTNINDEQALKVLNTSTSQFDQEVMQQLKDEMENKNQYTVKEFLDIYMKAIQLLEYKKAKEENIIREAKDKLNELINLQEQARIEEQNNPQNRQSMLYIYIDQARGLDRASQYHVKINYDNNQVIQTNPSNYSSDPQFNQEFKLKINNPNSIISFKIEDTNNHKLVGLVTQKLKQYYHQKKVDEWYILEEQGGTLGDINRQIAFAIQWVHSERLLYENILKENNYFDPVIKDQEEKLQQSIEMIRVLKHPFERDIEIFRQEIQEQQEEKIKKAKRGGNKKGAPEDDQTKNNENNEPNALQNCWTSCISLFNTDDHETNDHQNSPDPAHIQGYTSTHDNTRAQTYALTKTQSQVQAYALTHTQSQVNALTHTHQHAQMSASDQKTQPSVKIDSLLQLKENLVQAYVILAICVCFFRPNYIDICVALVFYSKIFALNVESCKKFSIVLIITIFIDILWMSLFTKNWFSYAGDSILCMTLFILLQVGECMLKVVIALLFMKLNFEMQDKHQPQTHDLQHTNNNKQYNYQKI